MKRATSKVACALVFLGAIILTGCSTGGTTSIADNGDTTSQTSCATPSGNVPCRTTTHLLHRALVSSYFGGALGIVDATQNRATGFAFKVGTQPTTLQPSPDGTLTLVNNTGSNTLSSFNNLQEVVKATVQLGGFTESYVTTVNNKSGFAAVPNYSNGNFNVPGAIVRFNPTDGSLNTAIPIPKIGCTSSECILSVRVLALDPAEKHLLAFSDADDNAIWVDLTTTDAKTLVPPYYILTLSDANGPVSLSRPTAAFFSADGSKAFVLSCGTECGGTEGASVTEIDTTSITPPGTPTTGNNVPATVTNHWGVNGARIGLIDTKSTPIKLYVAGSQNTSFANDCAFDVERTTGCTTSGSNNVQDGWFTIIDLTAGTASAPLRIGNGVKHLIRNVNGTFWVASLNCGVQSCVSRVNGTATSASVLDTAKGNATGISLVAIKGDSTDDVYTIEGGELFVYDQLGIPVKSEFSTDFRGELYDVEYIN